MALLAISNFLPPTKQDTGLQQLPNSFRCFINISQTQQICYTIPNAKAPFLTIPLIFPQTFSCTIYTYNRHVEVWNLPSMFPTSKDTLVHLLMPLNHKQTSTTSHLSCQTEQVLVKHIWEGYKKIILTIFLWKLR